MTGPTSTLPGGPAESPESPAGIPLGWVRTGVLLAAVAYTLIAALSFVSRGMTAGQVFEPVAALVSWIALVAIGRGRVLLGASLAISVVWIELTWSMHMSPHSGLTSLGAYVLLVVGTGLILGGQAALLVTAISWVAVPAAAISSGRPGLGFGAETTTMDAMIVWAVFLVQTAGAALLVRRALQSWLEAAAIRDASRLRYARLFETAADGLVTVAGGGRIVDANPAASRLLGRPAEGLLGRTLEEIVPGGGRAMGEANRAPLGIETPRGRVFIDVTNGRPHDTTLETLVVLRDVTSRVGAERKEALLTERLRQAQRVETVGRLAGTVAHDFNNLLTAVSGCASLLSDHEDGEVQALAREIDCAADQGAALTRQLLTFSRRTRVDPEAQDVARVVHDTAPLLQRILGERHRLLIEAEDGTCALIDRGQMQQLLVNLVANARDAMTDESGIVQIRVIASGDRAAIGRQVVIEVEDTGTGMEPEVQARLFEPFFTTKPLGRGTGLGLATVQGIVETWSGAIGVDSTPGRGTQFRIAIPGTPPEETQDEPVGTEVEAVGRGETVLLVEDDASVRRLTARILDRTGFRTVIAESADEAPAVALREHVDLLLTDVQMPGLTGPQVRARIEEQRPGLPCLFISGWIEPAQIPELGRDANVLLKPFHPDALVRRIRAILDTAADKTPRS